MRWRIVILGAATLGSALPAFPEEKTPARLEQQYDQESNPKKRARLAIDLTKMRMNLLRSAYKAGNPDQENEGMENYLAAVDRLGRAVREASDAGTSKRAEVNLREQVRQLEGLKMDVSYLERPVLEKVIAQVTRLREEILYSVLKPRQESSKK